MRLPSRNVFYLLFFFIFEGVLQQSSALLYIVRQTCTRGTVFTPVPSATNNICLQCICVMSNISYCKPLIVQLSIICSAAVNPTTPRAAVTVTAAATTTTTTTRSLTVPTIPPTTVAPATTPLGINPRASTPATVPAAAMVALAPAASAPAGMMNAMTANNLMMSMQPIMMMMMAAAGTPPSAPSAMASVTPAPAPAG